MNYSPNEHLEHRRAAAALEALCGDYGELERLAVMMSTFPASYGLPAPLVMRLTEVSSHLHNMHDEAVK